MNIFSYIQFLPSFSNPDTKNCVSDLINICKAWLACKNVRCKLRDCQREKCEQRPAKITARNLWLGVMLICRINSFFVYRKETGLERFVPSSLAESMKRKELKKLIGHFLKLNSNLTAPGQKNLTALQAKLHYLKIISELPSYGAKCFSTNFSVSY